MRRFKRLATGNQAPDTRPLRGNSRASIHGVGTLPLMDKSLLNRAQATLLALATAALFVLAVFNLLQERQSQQPDDGVWWSEASGGLQAQKVQADSPGQRAGIQTGDLLTAV